MSDGTLWIEDRIVSTLLARLKDAGWRPTATDTGGDGWVKVSTRQEAIEEINAVDIVSVEFTNDAGRTHYVQLVHGNGIDLISDWTYPREGTEADNFDATLTAVCDHIELTYGE